jgi:hypothetical protein
MDGKKQGHGKGKTVLPAVAPEPDEKQQAAREVDEDVAEVVSSGPGAVEFKIDEVGEKGQWVPEIDRGLGEGEAERLPRKSLTQDGIQHRDGVVVVDKSEKGGLPETNRHGEHDGGAISSDGEAAVRMLVLGSHR